MAKGFRRRVRGLRDKAAIKGWLQCNVSKHASEMSFLGPVKNTSSRLAKDRKGRGAIYGAVSAKLETE